MSARRGFILITVLVVMSIVLLGTTAMLFLLQADAAAARGAISRAGARSMAMSGLQVITHELNTQRETILDGELPELDEEYVIHEDESRAYVVRLLPHGPGATLLVPEAARLDLNTVTAGMLIETELIDEVLASAIVAHRDSLGRPYQSVAELLEVDGMTIDLLYGSLDELTPSDAGFEALPMSDGVAAPRGIADIVTVFAFEPVLQRSGELRINVNREWSEELGSSLGERFGEGAASEFKRLIDAGNAFADDGRILRALRTNGAPTTVWPDVIDALTTAEGDYQFGRLDINTASYEALLGLPGVGPDEAAAIVDAREALTGDERATIAWPATTEIIEAEVYEDIVGYVTTRSWTYRIRIAAGEVNTDDPDAPLEHPVVMEAVIDLSAPNPRLAYLRDITQLAMACRVAAMTPPDESDDREPPDEDEPADAGAIASEFPGLEPLLPFADDDAGPWSDEDLMDSQPSDASEPGDLREESIEAGPGDMAEVGEPGTTPRRRIGRWCSGG